MRLTDPINPISNFFLFISLIFAIATGYIILAVFIPQLSIPINIVRCKMGGGMWYSGNANVCIISYKDANKMCHSNSDCLGKCIAEKIDDTVGKCSENNIYSGRLCILEKPEQKPKCVFFDPFK